MPLPSFAHHRTGTKKIPSDAWQARAEHNRQDIAALEANLARSRYEQAIAQQLHSRATTPAHRDTWRIQVDVQQMIIMSDERDLAEHRVDLDLCQAMIAAVEADMAHVGV